MFPFSKQENTDLFIGFVNNLKIYNQKKRGLFVEKILKFTMVLYSPMLDF